MKLLLLGKDGQVGWQLQRSLAPHGEVWAVGREDADLQDFSALDRFRVWSPDVIVNAVGVGRVAQAEAEPHQAWRLNAELPAALSQLAAASGALLIHYSCDSVLANQAGGPWTEEDPVAPQGVLGESKWAGEVAIANSSSKALILRLSRVFGARGDSFVKTVLRQAATGEPLVVSDGGVARPTPAALVSTLTGVMLAQLRQGLGLQVGEVRRYHLAAAGAVSGLAFAKTVLSLASRTPGLQHLSQGTVVLGEGSSTPWGCAELACGKLEADFSLVMPDWRPYLVRILQLLSLKQNGY